MATTRKGLHATFFYSRLLASLVMPIIHETDGTSDKVSDIIDRTGFRLQRATNSHYHQLSKFLPPFPCYCRTILQPPKTLRLTQSPLGQHNPTLLPAFNHPPDPAAPVVGAAAVAEGWTQTEEDEAAVGSTQVDEAQVS